MISNFSIFSLSNFHFNPNQSPRTYKEGSKQSTLRSIGSYRNKDGKLFSVVVSCFHCSALTARDCRFDRLKRFFSGLCGLISQFLRHFCGCLFSLRLQCLFEFFTGRKSQFSPNLAWLFGCLCCGCGGHLCSDCLILLIWVVDGQTRNLFEHFLRISWQSTSHCT